MTPELFRRNSKDENLAKANDTKITFSNIFPHTPKFFDLILLMQTCSRREGAA